MDKEKLKEIKKELLALGIVSIMIGFGYNNSKEVKNNIKVPSKYSKIDNYYKYQIIDNKNTKLYNSKNIYLFFDKETFLVSEFIYNGATYFKGIALYDLESEEMLSYGDNLITNYNLEYFHSLLENSYQVSLNNIGNYIEGYIPKDYYTLDEIKELEIIIKEKLKNINSFKIKTR